MVAKLTRIGPKRPTRLFIKELMAERGWTQAQLAGRMDCAEGTISKKLKKPSAISVDWLGRFAGAFDLKTVGELFIDPRAPSQEELRAAGSPEELRSALALVQMARRTGTSG